MTRSITCRDAALLAFAHQRGELTPAERAALRAHAAECDACATLVVRVDDLLDAAATWDPVDEADRADADDLFARIEGAIDAAPAADAAADALFDRIEAALDADAGRSDDAVRADGTGTGTGRSRDAGTDDGAGTGTGRTRGAGADDGTGTGTGRSRGAGTDDESEVVDLVDALVRRRRAARLAVVAVVVAAAAAMLAVVLPFGGGPDTPAVDTLDAPALALDEPATPLDEDATPDARPDNDVTPPDASPEQAIAALALDAVDHGAVRVFGSPGVTYRVSDGPDHVLTLDEGAALIEFVGDGIETLRVDAGDWSVRVVGTAFYVEAGDLPDVRVLTGAVEVVSPGGSTRLTDGVAVEAGRPRSLSTAERDALVARVDVETHRAALRDRRTAAADPVPMPARSDVPAPSDTPAPLPPTDTDPSDPASTTADAATPNPVDPTADPSADPEPDTPDPSALAAEARERGRDAQRRRAWATAADAFETSLAADPGAPGAGSVRLDLARIYLRQLDDPERALPHLEAFVLANPTDVAAPAARDELCRVADALGREVALCAP